MAIVVAVDGTTAMNAHQELSGTTESDETGAIGARAREEVARVTIG
jgi:hypothetical protein